MSIIQAFKDWLLMDSDWDGFDERVQEEKAKYRDETQRIINESNGINDSNETLKFLLQAIFVELRRGKW